MKNTTKIFASLLFLIYISYVFRVVFPVIDYVIHYKYITEELCIEKDNPNNNCHGSCYLSKEMAREVTPLQKGKTIIIDFIKIPHLIPFLEDKLYANLFSLKYFIIQEKVIKYSSKPLSPPPKQSFC